MILGNQLIMKFLSKMGCWRQFVVLSGAAIALSVMCSCTGKKDNGGGFDADFGKLSDGGKVAYMMERVSPDSVARFICEASLGHIEGVKIDTLSLATLYAYEHYKSESDMQTFSSEMDDYVAHLPLESRMQIMKMLGEVDAQALGYQLGLEYVDHIRLDSVTPGDVKREIAEFKRACGADTMMYQRFLTGFKVALEVDRGKDLPEEIYVQFKNYK